MLTNKTSFVRSHKNKYYILLLFFTFQKGFTPLHVAAKYGSLDVAKLLLQRRAAADSAGKVNVFTNTWHFSISYNRALDKPHWLRYCHCAKLICDIFITQSSWKLWRSVLQDIFPTLLKGIWKQLMKLCQIDMMALCPWPVHIHTNLEGI